jgi:hypothetical protein
VISTSLQTKVDLIKSNISIDSLIKVNKEGTSTCPFCNKIKKWRTINNQYGWCYSTSCPSYKYIKDKRKSLDVIDIYCIIHNCSFSQAISELISSLDYEGHSNRLNERSEFLKQIMYIYQQELWNSNNKAINYLKERGFTERNIRNWELGYAPSYGALLRSRGFKSIDLEREGLYNPITDREFFSNRIIFPIKDNCNRFVHLQGRYILPIPEDKKDLISKYKATLSSLVPPITSFLFLEEKLNVYKSIHPTIVIAEGAPDTCSLAQMGLPSVGILGLSNLLKHTSKIKDFKHILVIGDNDKFPSDHEYFPNQYKSWRVLIPQVIDLQLSLIDSKVSIWTPPLEYGKDINDTLLYCIKNNIDPSTIKNQIYEEAIDIIDYLISNHGEDISYHQTILTLISKTGRGKESFSQISILKDLSTIDYVIKVFNY